MGYLSYDLGRVLEPAIEQHPYPGDRRCGPAALADRTWPLVALQRCETALVFDRLEERWWGVGPGAARLAEEVKRGALRPCERPVLGDPLVDVSASRTRYVDGIVRAIEYIRAGDVYQVNLAHRLSWRYSGRPRDLFASIAARARPWYGGFMQFDAGGERHAICSASPELLLSVDPGSGRVLSRPMKGTRPGAGDAAELRAAPKDRAELDMIVDLARNDLGRVCRLGSVRVDEPRAIERHADGGVLQATATVSGELRPDRTLNDMLHAVFPGGSVTGAPKIRAMQIIDRVEPVRRGPYCGALGFVSDCGAAEFNVMIRSALVSGRPVGASGIDGVVDYSVGAGIVADSDPESEWAETLVKARPFVEGLGAACSGWRASRPGEA